MSTLLDKKYEKKVSIIIPCYNQEKFVSEAIESALNQTYKNVEIVIVNDASKDNSSEVIKEYAQKHRNILFFDEKENRGVVKSRNLAIEASSGDYILPVDADDKIDPTFCEKAVKILDSDDDIKIVYSRVQLFGTRNKEFKLEAFNPNRIIFNNCIPNTAMYRKSDFMAVGGYKEYMKEGLEDWDLWLSILEITQNKGKCAYKINEKLLLYRQFDSITRSDTNLNKMNELYVNMLVHHSELYKNIPAFYEHISNNLPVKIEKKNKIFKFFFLIFVLFFVVVFLFLFLR